MPSDHQSHLGPYIPLPPWPVEEEGREKRDGGREGGREEGGREEEGREGGREGKKGWREGGREGRKGGREGGREEGGREAEREGEGEGCDTTTIHHMYSPYAVIGSTCTCTGLYMYMMRHNVYTCLPA